jgi:hypothetical protein
MDLEECGEYARQRRSKGMEELLCTRADEVPAKRLLQNLACMDALLRKDPARNNHQCIAQSTGIRTKGCPTPNFRATSSCFHSENRMLTYLPVFSRGQRSDFPQALSTPFRLSYVPESKLPTISCRASAQRPRIL